MSVFTNWQLPRRHYADDPSLAFEARKSRNYSDEGLWFIRGVIKTDNWFVSRYPYDETTATSTSRYYKTEFAAREAAAVLNLEIEVYRGLLDLTRRNTGEAQSSGVEAPTGAQSGAR